MTPTLFPYTTLFRSPFTEHDRLTRGNPGAAAGRNDAIRLTERGPDRHEMRVTVETDVDAFSGTPELIEAGVEVEIGANRDRSRERRIGQHARNVDQAIALGRNGAQALVRQAHGLRRAGEQERGT